MLSGPGVEDEDFEFSEDFFNKFCEVKIKEYKVDWWEKVVSISSKLKE